MVALRPAIVLRQTDHHRHLVRVEEDAGALRRSIARLARDLPRLRQGDAELVATEMATNLLRHTAEGGYVLYRRVGEGLELLAVDREPANGPAGMPSWATEGEAAGTSPPALGGLPSARGGGLGVGLAGVRRLASAFDAYTGPGGTVILVRLGPPDPFSVGHWRWGGVNVPLDDGESGDAWAISASGEHLTAMVVDGLGHGPGAAVAAQAAVAAFEDCENGTIRGSSLEELCRRAHSGMRGTRGGVLGVCRIDVCRIDAPEGADGADGDGEGAGDRRGPDRLGYAGVGNIAGRVLLGGKSQSLLSHGGTLGTQLHPPKARVMDYAWGPGATLVLSSDGIRSRWDPAEYERLLQHDPAIVAATVHRDHARNGDDATITVVQDVRGRHRASSQDTGATSASLGAGSVPAIKGGQGGAAGAADCDDDLYGGESFGGAR